MALKRGFKQLLAEANAQIETIAVKDALGLVSDKKVTFIDIRQVSEIESTGTIPGAARCPRGFLEFQADPESPMHNEAFSSGNRLVLFCATGGRSALAAKTLMDMGLPRICHMAGGVTAWKEAGGKLE